MYNTSTVGKWAWFCFTVSYLLFTIHILIVVTLFQEDEGSKVIA